MKSTRSRIILLGATAVVATAGATVGSSEAAEAAIWQCSDGVTQYWAGWSGGHSIWITTGEACPWV